MDVFSTKGLPPKLRREYWNDAICDAFTELVTDFAVKDDINAELASVALGDLTYARVKTTSSTVSHTKHHAAKAKD